MYAPITQMEQLTPDPHLSVIFSLDHLRGSRPPSVRAQACVQPVGAASSGWSTRIDLGSMVSRDDQCEPCTDCPVGSF